MIRQSSRRLQKNAAIVARWRTSLEAAFFLRLGVKRISVRMVSVDPQISTWASINEFVNSQQLALRLFELCHRKLEIILAMRRRDLHANARFAHRHDGEGKSDHVHSQFQHAIRHAAG